MLFYITRLDSIFNQFYEEVEILYRKIIENLFGSNSIEQVNSQTQILKDIEMYESQLNNMLQMLAKHEITPADFTAFKNDITPKLNALKSKNIDIDDVEDELRKYLKKGLMLIKNISQVYDYTPLEGKQKIIRSIFKKTLYFKKTEFERKK